MSRATNSPAKILHAPMLLEWTDERLRALSQDQLLSLLVNLGHQRSIGRLSEATAVALDARISAFLTKSSGAKRRRAG